ncbi:uncharacterized protein LOC107864811 [Capsicum annuum]|uniref:uncharacterized protein LOC107864811 n=1 Tax=Capsicum annuum TaxID=4072 RepID=UPI001FB1409B|nr:uncharacterized protein LOC107864811 [Capsicum annuum]
MKNCIVWNARGAKSAEFKKHYKDMVNIHQPCILSLLETKMSDHQDLCEEIGFQNHIQSEANGNSGDLVIMWRKDAITIASVSISSQAINAMVKVSSPPSSWYISIIYASNDFKARVDIWNQLASFSESYISPEENSWLVRGDFNEILRASEKFEGARINQNRSNLFMNYINYCSLIDLGFKGSKYTWSNRRYRNRNGLILKNLDRCLANDLWIYLYPEASITYLPRTNSDYSPLLLNIGSSPSNQIKPFRVESVCLSHQDFPNLINDSFLNFSCITMSTLDFEEKARVWNRLLFGNIFNKKKHLLAKLAGIQKSPNYPTSSFLQGLENTLLNEFNDILNLETEF